MTTESNTFSESIAYADMYECIDTSFYQPLNPGGDDDEDEDEDDDKNKDNQDGDPPLDPGTVNSPLIPQTGGKPKS